LRAGHEFYGTGRKPLKAAAKALSTKHQVQSNDERALLSIIPYAIFSAFKSFQFVAL